MKLWGQLWNFEDNLSPKGIILRHTNKPSLLLISTTRMLYWGEEKTVSEDHSTFAAKQIQAGLSLLDFVTLWLDMKS